MSFIEIFCVSLNGQFLLWRKNHQNKRIMKKKVIVIAALAATLLTSCVVKSLKPFYTKETLAYDASLLGKWKEKNRTWEIHSMTELIKKDLPILKKDSTNHSTTNSYTHSASVTINGKTKKMDIDLFKDKELNDIYKNSYLFINKPNDIKETEELYVVVPFKIKGQVFLDFTPFEIKGTTTNGFASMHHIGIHTLAKLHKNGEKLKISWLAEDKIEELFEQKKIRIKHEKIGIERNEILLTASSKELQKFIAKYMDSSDTNKWSSSVNLKLQRIE